MELVPEMPNRAFVGNFVERIDSNAGFSTKFPTKFPTKFSQSTLLGQALDIRDCAMISKPAGCRVQTHPSPLRGDRAPVGRVRGAFQVPRFLRAYIFVLAFAVASGT